MEHMFSLTCLIIACLAGSHYIVAQQGPVDKEKIGSINGRVYRSDRNEPVAEASVVLLVKVKDRTAGESQLTAMRTDAQGKYLFAEIPVGKYMLSVRTLYKSEDEAPCWNIAPAKTKSSDLVEVTVTTLGEPMQIVLVEDVMVKAKDEVKRDVDIACSKKEQ